MGRYTKTDNSVHGFILNDGQYRPFDVPDSEFTMVRGINDQGDVAGAATIKG